MNVVVSHVLNPTTSKDIYSKHWFSVLNISYLNEIIKSMNHNDGRIVKKGLLIMWKTKCMIFMMEF